MSKSKNKTEQKEIALIEYDFSVEPPHFYATGARIIAMGPNFNKISFYFDDPQDELLEETVYLEKEKQVIRPTKYRFEGKRHVKRRFVVTVNIPMTLMKSLAEVLTNTVKQHEVGTQHGDQEK